jgi:hypothetical protein
MRSACFVITLVLASSAASAGPQQFASGYGGISWGMSVTDVVGLMPDGHLYFSAPEGCLDYIAMNDEPLFGVSRTGQLVEYHFGVDGRVDQIAVHIAYENREELLGAMISQFGTYILKRDYGGTEIFYWSSPKDLHGTARVSRSPIWNR